MARRQYMNRLIMRKFDFRSWQHWWSLKIRIQCSEFRQPIFDYCSCNWVILIGACFDLWLISSMSKMNGGILFTTLLPKFDLFPIHPRHHKTQIVYPKLHRSEDHDQLQEKNRLLQWLRKWHSKKKMMAVDARNQHGKNMKIIENWEREDKKK